MNTKYIVEIYKLGQGVESNKRIARFESPSYPAYYPRGTELIFGNTLMQVVRTVVNVKRDMQGNDVVIHQILVKSGVIDL